MTRRRLPPTALEELRRNLETLKLTAMVAALDEALEQAQTLQQGYGTFIAGLVAKEVLAKAAAASERRINQAKFSSPRTFDTFDWTFQKGLNVQLVKDLMTLDFVRQGRPVLMLGRPGTGKTHMAIALGHLAAGAGYRVRYFEAAKLLPMLYATLADGSTDHTVRSLARLDLLIIDDLRTMPTKPEYASLLYELIEARYGRRSTLVSSNLSVKEWGSTLGNPTLVASLVDRLMERAHVVNIRRGRSYRVHGPEAPPPADCPDSIAAETGSAENEA